MTPDQDRLNDFLGRFVGDLGATMAAGAVVLGDKLGLYRGLLPGPATAAELAERTGTDPRYLTEWLRGQAAGGYVTYDPDGDRYSLTAEQAFALTDPDGPVYLPGAFQLALGALRAEPRIAEAFRTVLTAQDARPWRPHVTVQNKVEPDEARRTLASVQAGHAPYETVVEALALWHYGGGPWEAAGEFAFG